MSDVVSPNWIVRGKTIDQLIKELQSFEDRSLFVEVSTDDGLTSKPISLVLKRRGKCILVNCEDAT